MKKWLFLLLLPFSFLRSFEIPYDEIDQFELFVIAPMFVLTKAIELGKEHHFRYIKIISYEYQGLDYHVAGFCEKMVKKGKYVEYKDEHLTMGIVGFRTKPDDQLIIDLKKYKEITSLFEKLEEGI